MKRRLFFGGATAMIVAAIIFGIITIGGPREARRDAFDRQRYDDLKQISSALFCSNWRILQPVLPDALTLENIRAYCGGIQIDADVLVDNETGTPYTYSRITESTYAVCATFHDAEKAMRQSYQRLGQVNASFNPETGCVTGRVR
ncbi:hypothetical protein [Yoonia sp.]|uniref:hypothetical protein n=1 Tax=Yoonia sp. TaxID=2212373 RepID=UPI0025E9BFFE|nr:hypothetical protein [Yoonia sp.]